MNVFNAPVPLKLTRQLALRGIVRQARDKQGSVRVACSMGIFMGPVRVQHTLARICTFLCALFSTHFRLCNDRICLISSVGGMLTDLLSCSFEKSRHALQGSNLALLNLLCSAGSWPCIGIFVSWQGAQVLRRRPRSKEAQELRR